jgi:hypothetical protein
MNAVIWSGSIVLISALCAIVFPFTTYATTLATFGIAHVAIELRYVDSRFHAQLDGALERSLVLLLMSIALLRCCAIFGWMPSGLAHLIELSFGIGLVLIATQHVYRQNWQLGLLGMAIGGTIGIGIIIDPIATSTTFAILHNLTPIGFILEHQDRQNYVQKLLVCGCIFGILPLLIILYQFLSISHLALETNIAYLSAFIAPVWQKSTLVYPLFSAVVFLQCMHYTAVIGLFSQWTSDRSPTLLPWCANRYFYCLLGGISVCLLIAFQHNFGLTRSLYGIVASIHAWLEIPLLLLSIQKIVERKSTEIRSQIGTK